MRTWKDYKEHAKTVDSEGGRIIEEMDGMADIIGAIISKRNEIGLSQCDLADRAGLSQPTIARIESFDIVPSLDTLLAILRALGLNTEKVSSTLRSI